MFTAAPSPFISPLLRNPMMDRLRRAAPRSRAPERPALGRCHSAGYNKPRHLREDIPMMQVTAATFENGVLVPDQPLNLSPHARVRLTVNPLDEDEDTRRQKAWEDLQGLWQTSTFD